jgi:PleD family two-component response regulator
MVWSRHPDRKITVSIGIAGCSDGPTVQPLKWFEQADANLYQAKNSGRNKTITKFTDGSMKPLDKAG